MRKIEIDRKDLGIGLRATCRRRVRGGVQVVDSRSAAMGTGFVALAAARTARHGADLDTAAAAAQEAAGRVHAFIVVQRLENLRRALCACRTVRAGRPADRPR